MSTGNRKGSAADGRESSVAGNEDEAKRSSFRSSNKKCTTSLYIHYRKTNGNNQESEMLSQKQQMSTSSINMNELDQSDS